MELFVRSTDDLLSILGNKHFLLILAQVQHNKLLRLDLLAPLLNELIGSLLLYENEPFAGLESLALPLELEYPLAQRIVGLEQLVTLLSQRRLLLSESLLPSVECMLPLVECETLTSNVSLPYRKVLLPFSA